MIEVFKSDYEKHLQMSIISAFQHHLRIIRTRLKILLSTEPKVTALRFITEYQSEVRGVYDIAFEGLVRNVAKRYRRQLQRHLSSSMKNL